MVFGECQKNVENRKISAVIHDRKIENLKIFKKKIPFAKNHFSLSKSVGKGYKSSFSEFEVFLRDSMLRFKKKVIFDHFTPDLRIVAI